MRRTKAEAAETKAAILIAAEHVFFEKGFAATTLDEIAAVANVTRGAIYWHFASKNELFLELYNSARLPQAVSMLDLENSICDERTALAVIEKACCDWFKLLAHDRQRQRMLTILLRTNVIKEFHQVAQEMEALDDSHTQNLERTLEVAACNQRLAPSWTPASSSYAVKWVMKGLTYEWLLSGQKFDLAAEGCDSVKRLFASFRLQPH
ncbi:helix-turn-helix domain-containing protein [Rhizobium sp. S152]|uniref:TetR/AcrR family transcriptional regulator n=1 Tax=Rhizobium sp. S152 TaxID=3055038 RepID=UPI0025A97262|nr:helix-turn-helix domain-containing protein [Rhizobium sp. S152]MDM9627899.1 helix-turn-helix domain-containing protein [Rhizobium sp. S152]